MRLDLIRSNIQAHGLLWAVRYEEARYLRRGLSAQRSMAMAFAIVTGRWLG